MKALFFVLFLCLSQVLIRADGTSAPPDSLASLWQAAITAGNNKDYATALQKLQEFRDAGGDPFLSTLNSGWFAYLKQDYAGARADYNEAARIEPSAITPLLGLLNVAQAEKDSTEIPRAIDAVLRVDPINYRAQMAGATLQYAAQNYREALSYYHRVRQYYPEDPDALSGEAWSLYNLGRGDEAVTSFQTLLSINPSYPDAKQGFELSQSKSANHLTVGL